MRYLYLVATVISMGGLVHADEVAVNGAAIVEVGNQIPEMPKTEAEWEKFFNKEDGEIKEVLGKGKCDRVIAGAALRKRTLDNLKKSVKSGKEADVQDRYKTYVENREYSQTFRCPD